MISLPDQENIAIQPNSGEFGVELNIPSEMEMIRLVEDLGTALMELKNYSSKDRDMMRLAIHETLVNAIEHGNIETAQPRITVRFFFRGPCFYTVIDDEGTGFEMENLPDPTSSENLLKPSGRGIFLAQKLTENFTVTKLPNRGFRVEFCRLKHDDKE